METELNTFKRLVIVGATSAIAEHCARFWVAGAAIEMTLIGRDAARLERVAADLRVRGAASHITTMTSGFQTSADIERTVEAVYAAGPVDLVLIAHGMLPDQSACEEDLASTQEALEINGLSPVLFAEAFARRLARQQQAGTIALIGSVAGDRGRKSNYVYGAAKGLVDRYAQGLQHRFAGTAVKVVLIKPGPTATPMTAHMQGTKMASVEAVAHQIIKAIAAGKSTVYAPGKWRLIMLIIRHLPAFVFNKLNI